MGRGDGRQTQRADRHGPDPVRDDDPREPRGERHRQQDDTPRRRDGLMAVAVLPTREALARDLSAISTRRRVKNAIMSALMALSVLIVGFVLVLALAIVFTKGWS